TSSVARPKDWPPSTTTRAYPNLRRSLNSAGSGPSSAKTHPYLKEARHDEIGMYSAIPRRRVHARGTARGGRDHRAAHQYVVAGAGQGTPGSHDGDLPEPASAVRHRDPQLRQRL